MTHQELISKWHTFLSIDPRWQISLSYSDDPQDPDGSIRFQSERWEAELTLNLNALHPEAVIVHELLELSFWEMSEIWEVCGRRNTPIDLIMGRARNRLIETLVPLIMK